MKSVSIATVTSIILALGLTLYGIPGRADAQTIAQLQRQISRLQRQNTRQQNQINRLLARVAVLESREQVPQNILDLAPYVSIDNAPLNGLNGPHVLFDGANVHIRSGSGSTNDDLATGLTGLGNLVVGYNEERTNSLPGDRLGSHNVVIGTGHRYTSFGGLVAGSNNSLTAPSASVSGGTSNNAFGNSSSVCGGTSNAASGTTSSVLGGIGNNASGTDSTVSGGVLGAASGGASSVSGGSRNIASGTNSSVSGGAGRVAAGGNSWAAGALLQ